MKKFNLITKIVFHVTLVVYGLMAVAGSVMFANKDIVNGFLGGGTQSTSGESGNVYYDTEFEKMQDVRAKSLELIEESMAEGAVLLKNENNALPLNKNDSVSLYGMASYHSVHTGQGSSGSETGDKALQDRVTFYDGLKAAGLNVNSALNDYYKGQSRETYLGHKNFMGAAEQVVQMVVTDIGWDSLPDARNNEADAAIMVLARNSGEAKDLYMDTTMDDGSTRVLLAAGGDKTSVGDALELTANEKTVLKGLQQLKEQKKITKIIVIMNSASPLQCEFLDNADYGIDSCLWVGTIGTNGATAIGKILTGEVNPSGRTADTFWANSKYNPVYYNFGAIEYGNSGVLKNYYSHADGQYDNKYYVVYQEGIYNGYKYTETRYEDVVTNRANAGNFDYNTVVTYPFGYGLSYTNFVYSGMKVSGPNAKHEYAVSVDVTNDGKVAGKEVVQIYVQKPYTQNDIQNGIEKASVELVGFAKTSVIEPGDTKTVRIIVKEKYFAAYDANDKETYVIGSSDKNDKYLLTAAKDAHDAVNNVLQYKIKNKIGTVDQGAIVANAGREKGNADLVWDTYIAYDATTYSTNDFITEENKLDYLYEGAEKNYGVNKITNQFDNADFQKSDIFTSAEKNQTYMTRNDWAGTYGKRIALSANSALADAQKAPAVEEDNVPYPKYGEDTFYESDEVFDEMKLIYLRRKDFNDPLWQDLLDKMSYEDYCTLLQDGLRVTKTISSIAAPGTAEQNGAIAPVHSHEWNELIKFSEKQGFVMKKDPEHKADLPPVFVCNGIVAASYNIDLAERLGKQQGEEAAWSGYHGMYGLGVNIHRGAYCGRTFEYYSEDGFLTGYVAGYQTVGYHKLGEFVLMKHAVLNDQESHRAGLNVWANEQSIREIYCRAIEVVVEVEREHESTRVPMVGVMTGMNRLGPVWAGAQGFCNKVLKAEFGMRGYIISDYNSSRRYISPVQGVLNGNDLPDGTTSGWTNGSDYDGNNVQFSNYGPDKNYGKLAWAMRDSAHHILYTIVNSIAMNGIDGDTSFSDVTPAWQIAVPVVTRVLLVIFIWSTLAYAASIALTFINDYRKEKANAASAEQSNQLSENTADTVDIVDTADTQTPASNESADGAESFKDDGGNGKE